MRSKLSLSLAVVMFASTVLPALAEANMQEAKANMKEDEVNINDFRILTTPDPAPITEKSAGKGAGKGVEKEKTKAASAHKAGKIFAAPMAVGGVLMGMTVGVPVRIARDISHETLRMRDQMTDDVSGSDKPDLFAKTVGSYSGMAYGVVSGVIKGSIKGTERAIDCGARKPFSKESLSLQDPN